MSVKTINDHDIMTIMLPLSLKERLLETVRQRSPQKSFGYFLSSPDSMIPTDFIIFEDNIRNSPAWRSKFESYGQYFLDHDDAGFVTTPEESWRVQKEIWARGLVEIGVFHSHLRHPANFSQIDYDLHRQRFGNLWHMIISMRNPELPQVRAFAVSRSGVQELYIAPLPDHGKPLVEYSTDALAGDAAIVQAQELLKLDNSGLPKCKDSRAIVAAINDLLRAKQDDVIEELLINRFLRDSGHRYEEHIAPKMCSLQGGRFLMGTPQPNIRHFCGESPSHVVELSPFSIMQVPVTNELFSIFNPLYRDIPIRDQRRPAVNLTWFDATVFAMWMGCRLPTEAEWEFACGGGSEGDWCCEDEKMLAKYAWYSDNSGGEIQIVGTREANLFGLYDFHGNIWEWCQDIYDQDFYSYSPIIDPVLSSPPPKFTTTYPFDRVCRGGCMHSFSEMCRTHYRFHEPPDFRANDLGIRLGKARKSISKKGQERG